MAKLSKIVKIKQADYSTLLSKGQVTIDSITHVYDPDALYIVVDPAAPEYADSAGYAANAGTAQVAVKDASGNNIVETYDKKPLIIEVTDEDTSVPSGTYSSVTQAIAQNREVIFKVTRNIADREIVYLALAVDNSSENDAYYFSAMYDEILICAASLYSNDAFEFTTWDLVHRTGTETISGNKTFSGTTTFTGITNLGSKATATTPAAGDNDKSVATTAFVQNAINSLPTPMQFKGSLGTGGTYTSSTIPAAAASNKGWTLKVITAGTYQGVAAKVGDTLISDGTNWILIPSGDEPSGTVTSITLNATSPIAIDNSTAITTSGTRTISHANSGVTAGTYDSVTVDAKGHVTGGTNPNKYWANLQVGTAANYITEPEFKSVKINGSSTNSASTQNAVIQYDTTNKCIKFVFN